MSGWRGLRYTQGTGFIVVEDMDAALGIAVPESLGDDLGLFLKNAGWAECSGPEEIFGDGTDAGPKISFFHSDRRGQWLIDIDFYSRAEWIVVDGDHDMMALRLALAPLIQQAVLESIMVTGSLAAFRGFMHQHNHEPGAPCSKCETPDEKSMRLYEQKRRAEQKRREPE